jgi:hypothetical protein
MPIHRLTLVYEDGTSEPHGEPYDDLKKCLADLRELQSRYLAEGDESLRLPTIIEVIDETGAPTISVILRAA